jgi:hypothetical protein
VLRLAFLLLPLVGCSADTYELFVEVRADLAPAVDFDRVVTELFTDELLPAIRRVETSVTAGDDYAAGHRVAELSALEPGSYIVRVTLERAGTAVQTQRLLVRLETDRAVAIRFDAACSGINCPMPGDPSAATECAAGSCVEPSVSCQSASDCPIRGDCASVSCAAELCVYDTTACFDAGTDADVGVDTGPDGTSCDAVSAGTDSCVPPGTSAEGAPCTSDADCATDSVCFRHSMPACEAAPASTCRRRCSTDSDCDFSGGSFCLLSSASGERFCTTPCEPVTSTCATGLRCTFVEHPTLTYFVTDCQLAGPGVEGDVALNACDCGPGFGRWIAYEQCARFCSSSHGCPPSQTCVTDSALVYEGRTYGFCSLP